MQKDGHFAQLVKQFQNEEEAEEKEEEWQAAVDEDGNPVEAPGGEQVVGAASNAGAQASGATHEQMRERAESEGETRRTSSVGQQVEKPQKPDSSKAKLMTSEESATGVQMLLSVKHNWSNTKYNLLNEYLLRVEYLHIALSGSVSPRVFWWYIRAMTFPLCLLFITFFALFEALQIFSNIWLSNMADDQQNIDNIKTLFFDNYTMEYIKKMLASNSHLPFQMVSDLQNANSTIANNFTTTWNDFSNRRDYYLWWYLGYGGIQAILVAIFSISFSLMVASASRYIHIKMLGNWL